MYIVQSKPLYPGPGGISRRAFLKYAAAAGAAALFPHVIGCGGAAGSVQKNPYVIAVNAEQDDSPIQGAEVSIYPAGLYNIRDDSGDANSLQPKPVPDAVTGADGAATVHLQDGEYNAVIKVPNHLTQRIVGISTSQGGSPSRRIACYQGSYYPAEVWFCGAIEGNESRPQGIVDIKPGDTVPLLLKGVNNTDQSSYPGTHMAVVQVYKVIDGKDLCAWPGNQNNPDETITALPGERPYKHGAWYADPTIFANWGYGLYNVALNWLLDHVQIIGSFNVSP